MRTSTTRHATPVLAIRIWHFVFDKTHSTSELARALMNESADEADHSGAAHCPNHLRKQSVVASAKQTRMLMGASLETAQLEVAAGVAYRHVVNTSVYKNLLAHYAGHSDKSPGGCRRSTCLACRRACSTRTCCPQRSWAARTHWALSGCSTPSAPTHSRRGWCTSMALRWTWTRTRSR